MNCVKSGKFKPLNLSLVKPFTTLVYQPLFKTPICVNCIKPVGIFGNNISICPDIMRKRTPISLNRVPPVQRIKVKDYISSVGSPCIYDFNFNRT